MHPTPLRLVAPTLGATHQVAAVLARASRPSDVVVLAGEMGAGKTAFAQGFGRELGVDEPITSPTFTLVQSYDVRRDGRALQLHHADIYRLDQLDEVADLAFGELAEFAGIVLVEWGDVVADTLGDHLLVELEPHGETSRTLTVTARGMAWARRWEVVAAEIRRLEFVRSGGAGASC